MTPCRYGARMGKCIGTHVGASVLQSREAKVTRAATGDGRFDVGVGASHDTILLNPCRAVNGVACSSPVVGTLE